VWLKVFMHYMQNHPRAELLSPFLHAVTIGTAMGVAFLRILHNAQTGASGSPECPGHEDMKQVADTWLVATVTLPMISFLAGAYYGFNGAGSSMTSKAWAAGLFIMGTSATICVGAMEHTGNMQLSVLFLGFAVILAHSLGFFVAHRQVVKAHEMWRTRQLLTIEHSLGTVSDATNITPVQRRQLEVVVAMEVEKAKASMVDLYTCVVCLTNRANVLLMPCRHLKCCLECVRLMTKSQTPPLFQCPLCRAGVDHYIHVHT